MWAKYDSLPHRGESYNMARSCVTGRREVWAATSISHQLLIGAAAARFLRVVLYRDKRVE